MTEDRSKERDAGGGGGGQASCMLLSINKLLLVKFPYDRALEPFFREYINKKLSDLRQAANFAIEANI